MSCYDASKLSARAGGLKVSPIGTVTDANLAARLYGYKTGTARRFMSLGENEISARLPPDATLWVSRKVDGECTILYHTKDETLLLSPTGRVVLGSAAAAEARKRLQKAGVEQALIAGELYVHRPGTRERAHDVSRTLGDGAEAELVKALRFAAYDVIEVLRDKSKGAEQALLWPYADRLKAMQEWFAGGTAVDVVQTEVVKGSAAVKELYERWVGAEGAEGLVVRSEQPVAHKVKPRQTLDLAIVGYVEGRDDKSGTVREVLVALVRPGGLFHIIGSVGTGFTDEERQSLLATLKTLDATSEYVETNRHYFAYQMVRPEVVIEVRVTDLLQEDSRGKAVQQMVLRHLAKDSSESQDGQPAWQIVRKMPLCSLVHPVYERIRTDKEANEVDCRLAQVTDLLVVPEANAVAAPLQMQPSQVLRREVYTKAGKGGTAVRKLVVWKTNKEGVDPLYPAYVLHYTDYSPGRAELLQREVRVAGTEARIQQMAEEMLKENIKKGWSRV